MESVDPRLPAVRSIAWLDLSCRIRDGIQGWKQVCQRVNRGYDSKPALARNLPPVKISGRLNDKARQHHEGVWSPVPCVRMRKRYEPSREKNEYRSLHSQPSQQLNNGDKNAGLNERRKHEPLDDMGRRITVSLPKAEVAWRKMKESYNRGKQRSESVVVAGNDKDEYDWRRAARKKCIKLFALAHGV